MVLRFLVQLLLVTFVAAELKPLPHNIVVTHYALDISISMPAANQTLRDIVGSVQPAMVQITFEVLEDTDKIHLNAEKLIMSEVLINNENGTSDYAEMSYTYDEGDQLLILESPFTLIAGERHSLNISYGYITQTAPAGLFFSTWMDENNKTRYVAGTHFKPISARKMVPCLDNPSFRATWQITVEATPGYSVSSNTKMISLVKSKHSWRHTFETTPSIPSYLVAIVVHDYDERNFKSPKGFEYNLIGPSETLNDCNDRQTSFIGLAIDHLMDKFNVVNFPFENIDFIQIPKIPAKGNGNPGLITFRDFTFCKSQRATGLVVDKLLHQWFGGVVTPISWGNVVMSEGLATFYTRQVVLNFGGYDVPTIYPGDLLSEDDTPIVAEPTTLDESDYIGRRHYDKSAFLFTMMKDMVGAKGFDQVVNEYLKRNENGWGSLDGFLTVADDISVYEKPLKPIVMPYFTRRGYPILYIVDDKDEGIRSVVGAFVKGDNDTYFNQYPIPKLMDYYVPLFFIQDDMDYQNTVQVGTYLPFWNNHFIVPLPNSYHRTCYIDPETWLRAALHVQYNAFWRGNMLRDFLVCEKHRASPQLKEVLEVLTTEPKHAWPVNKEKWRLRN